MTMNEVKQTIDRAVLELFKTEFSCEVARTDEQFGDYSSNIAMQLAPKLGKSPREIAEILKSKIDSFGYYQNVEVAGPGFINISLSDKDLWSMATGATNLPKTYAGQTIVAEYSDPNPFKVLHAGHLYTSIVGDAIANLFEGAGASVHRVNFGGDVGLHVAKTIWAMLEQLGGENPEALNNIPVVERSEWMAKSYVKGNNIYDEDTGVKRQIIGLNKKIYQISNDNDRTSPLAQIYWTTREWSYDYFKDFYARIGTIFEKFYPESQTAGPGLEAVKSQIGKVFQESDNAVVFKGEEHGLHTRVFINSEGLPTYETKDVGLMLLKWQDYKFDKSVIITGNEQEQYLAVVLKAIEQFEPELAKKTAHLTHGLVKLKGGVKMSSRLGNILRATDILDAAAQANKAARDSNDTDVVLGAVKYSFLKQRLGADIIYDPEESVSLVGNSGPYLQYAYARACSILEKTTPGSATPEELDGTERSLARKVGEYPEVVAKATDEMMPHHICTYLYELAQEFNRFYEVSRVAGDPREAVRASLVSAYRQVLSSGLTLLGIATPEHI